MPSTPFPADYAAGQELPEGLTPVPLMQIGTGFWAANTLATAVEIDLFGRIDRAGGLTREQAAKELGFEDRPTDLFLAGCASLGLLDKDGETKRPGAA